MSTYPPPPPGPPSGGGPVGPPPVGYPQYQQQPGYAPGTYAPGAPFRRNPMLITAQVLAIIQGSLVLLVGGLVILVGVAFHDRIHDIVHNVSSTINTANLTAGVVIAGGVVAALFGILIIFLAVRTGHPSQGARWTLGVLYVLFVLSGVRTLLTGGGAGSIVSLVWDGLIVFGLIIDPATYRAFANRR